MFSLNRNGRVRGYAAIFGGFLFAGAGMLAPPPAVAAETQQAASQLLNQPIQSTLTGNWLGIRKKLLDDGFSFNLSYINQAADDFAGGKRQGTDFANQIAAGVDIDLGKIAGIEGGIIHLGMSQRFGRSASADYVGNEVPSQFLTLGGEDLRLTNFSYEQSYADKFVTTEIGYYPMGNTFGADPIFCTFMSNAFCGHLVVEAHDSNGWSNYPLARWGGRMQFNFKSHLYLQVGVFDSNPTNLVQADSLKFSLAGSSGVLVPVEIGIATAFGGLPGHYKLGVYYDSSAIAEVTNSKRIETGREGAYAIFDQMLWRFAPDHSRGLIVFGGYSHTDDATTALPQQILAGFMINGPFASRPNDYINFGFSNCPVNHRLIDEKYQMLARSGDADFELASGETDIEAGYGFRPEPWLLLHPNIQYVGNPGAFSYKHIPSAWVFGFDTRVTF